MEFCLSRIFAGLLVESWKPQHIILMRYGFQGYWKWKMEWSQLFMYAQEVASALLQGSNGIQVKLPSFLKPFSKSSNMMNGIENDHWVAIQYIFVKRREKGTHTSSIERSRSWELDLSSGNAWEDRIACITWNQTRFWFSIKFTYECCWKYSASFVLASGLFGACSASKEFLECTGIIIHHPWLLLILIPQFRIHKYKRQREPPASFPPSPSIKQISCTVNCC